MGSTDILLGRPNERNISLVIGARRVTLPCLAACHRDSVSRTYKYTKRAEYWIRRYTRPATTTIRYTPDDRRAHIVLATFQVVLDNNTASP